MQSNQKQVAVVPQSSPAAVSFPSQQEWGQISQIAHAAFKSGLLPTSIKNVEGATIVALKAWELGLPPMMAYSHIHVINGKPTMSAELMQTLARKNLPGLKLNVLESTEKRCAIQLKRPEPGSQEITYEFTLADAEKAKLLNKDVWKQYPKAMLFSRCMSAILRAMVPDAMLGISYTPEELDGPVELDGKTIETTSTPVAETNRVDSQTLHPVESQATPLPPSQNVVKPIPESLNLVLKVMQTTQIDPTRVKDHCKLTYGIESLKELSDQQRQELAAWIENSEEPEWQKEVRENGALNPHQIK